MSSYPYPSQLIPAPPEWQSRLLNVSEILNPISSIGEACLVECGAKYKPVIQQLYSAQDSSPARDNAIQGLSVRAAHCMLNCTRIIERN